MKSALCDRLGFEFPLFAFSHCRDVVAAVTNAGGFGVLGATIHTPETLEIELAWIDDQVNGKPYGVDLLIPNNMDAKDGAATCWPATAWMSMICGIGKSPIILAIICASPAHRKSSTLPSRTRSS